MLDFFRNSLQTKSAICLWTIADFVYKCVLSLRVLIKGRDTTQLTLINPLLVFLKFLTLATIYTIIVFTDYFSSSDEDENPAVQVTVKFAQRSLDKVKMSQEVSHQRYLTKLEEEPWCETTYHNSTSPAALVRICFWRSWC